MKRWERVALGAGIVSTAVTFFGFGSWLASAARYEGCVVRQISTEVVYICPIRSEER